MKLVYGALEFVGGITLLGWRVLLQIFRGHPNIRLTIQQMSVLGVNTIPIAVMVMSFAGGVFTFMIARQIVQYGGKPFLGSILLYVLLREFIPVFTGIVFSGKVGATITSEIGTMKISEQIDALRALSTDPDWYLVVPRVIAGALTLPLVAIFAGYGGWFSGYYMAYVKLGMNYMEFGQAVPEMIGGDDYLLGFLKCFIFGIIIVLTACHTGYHARGGASGVGRAVTNGVVTNIVILFAVNLVITYIADLID